MACFCPLNHPSTLFHGAPDRFHFLETPQAFLQKLNFHTLWTQREAQRKKGGVGHITCHPFIHHHSSFQHTQSMYILMRVHFTGSLS